MTAVLNPKKARPSINPNRVPRQLNQTTKPAAEHPPTMMLIVSTDPHLVEYYAMSFMEFLGEEASGIISSPFLARPGCPSVATGFAEVKCDMSSDLFLRIKKTVIAELAKST